MLLLHNIPCWCCYHYNLSRSETSFDCIWLYNNSYKIMYNIIIIWSLSIEWLSGLQRIVDSGILATHDQSRQQHIYSTCMMYLQQTDVDKQLNRIVICHNRPIWPVTGKRPYAIFTRKHDNTHVNVSPVYKTKIYLAITAVINF